MAGKGTKYWVERLSKADMPVLAASVQHLLELTRKPDTQIAELADVILRDANLTTQVLRVANSAHYNPNALKINTVSRAIVILGFDQIRSICVSLIIVEKLLRRSVRRRLVECLAKSFHAAIQARELSRYRTEHQQEEAFIAGLLLNLGELVFWASDPAEANELEYRLGNGDIPKLSCQLLLGTSFNAISKGLCETWHMGPLLAEALGGGRTGAGRSVAMAGLLADAAAHGWQTDMCRTVIQAIADDHNKPECDISELLHANALQAIKFTEALGGGFSHLIPNPSEGFIPSSAGVERAEPLNLDPVLQLSILRELTASVGDIDLYALFQMVLEGLHRGVGLERVLVCMVSGKQLYGRYAIGEKTKNWRKNLSFDISEENNLLTHCLSDHEPRWIKNPKKQELYPLYTPVISRHLGKNPALLAGVHLNGRPVAVFYADRYQFGDLLNAEQFEGFKHFVNQTEVCLKLLTQKP